MKKLAYLTASRLPTEKAYGVQMAHTMKAFTQVGFEVTLVSTNRPNHIKKTLFEYYGFKEGIFSIVKVKSVSILRTTRIGFWAQALSYALCAAMYIKKNHFDVLYSREPFPLFFLTKKIKHTMYEMHDFPQSFLWFHRLLCNRVSHLVTTNNWAKEQCVKKLGISEEKITVIPNGYDEKQFKNLPSKEEARRELGFDLNAKIVMYTGHLYSWKGVDTLANAAALLPEHTIVFVGGLQEDRKRMMQKYPQKNIVWIEHQPPQKIPTYLRAADVLVLPNIPENQHSTYSTSPIKLFEYLASGRPVVASRLPSIESFVDESVVCFFEPGNIDSLVAQVKAVIAEQSDEGSKSRIEYAKKFSWQAKAEKIASYFFVN